MRTPIFVSSLLVTALLAAPAPAQRAANGSPTTSPRAATAPRVLLHRTPPTGQWRSSIAVSGDRVFLSHASVLESVPRGGGAVERIDDAVDAPVAAGPTSVQWLEGGSLHRSMPLPHGPVSPRPTTLLSFAPARRGNVALVGETLVSASMLDGIDVRPVANGPVIRRMSGQHVSAIATAGDDVFLIASGSVMRFSMRTDAVTHLASTGDGQGIAVDGEFVYWSVLGPGTVVPNGPAPPGAKVPSCFLDSTVYRAGEVWRVRRAGGKAERVVGGVEDIGAIVVGRSSVFIQQGGTGGLTFRAPKSGGIARRVGMFAAIATDGPDVFALDDKGDLVTFAD